VTFLVDTSVWSLALRRDTPPDMPEIAALRRALVGGEDIASTGFILAELLCGRIPPAVQAKIRHYFGYIDILQPSTDEYIAAAELINNCRGSGIQLTLVDAVIASLAISRDLTLLTTDRDFHHVSSLEPLRLWAA